MATLVALILIACQMFALAIILTGTGLTAQQRTAMKNKYKTTTNAAQMVVYNHGHSYTALIVAILVTNVTLQVMMLNTLARVAYRTCVKDQMDILAPIIQIA